MIIVVMVIILVNKGTGIILSNSTVVSMLTVWLFGILQKYKEVTPIGTVASTFVLFCKPKPLPHWI